VTRSELALVALVTAVAAGLRLWRLGELPPGLHVDEAFNILDARAVLAGWRPVFLPENAGREALFTYLQAPLLAVLGESARSARAAAALLGTLAVPALWALVRSLPIASAPRVAVLAGALLGASYWHLHFSRFGIRAIAFALLVTLTLWAWWLAVGGTSARGSCAVTGAEERPDRAARGGRRTGAAVGAGLLLGLAVYVHPAGRVLVAVPALHAGLRWLRAREREPVRALAVAGLVGLVTALPMARYWAVHPSSLTAHAGEVSILAQGPSAVLANAVRVAGMVNVAGDPAPWRNLTERPLLSAVARATHGTPVLAPALRGRPAWEPLTGALFLVGLAGTLAAARRGASWADLVLVALVVTVAPSVVTDAAPNFSRAIGALPLLCLLPALALSGAARRLAGRWGAPAGAAAVALVLGTAGASTARDYFVVWAGHPDTPSAFDADKLALARYADQLTASGRAAYLSPEMARHPTVRLACRSGARGFRASAGAVLPPPYAGRPAYLLLGPEAESGDAIADRLHSLGATSDVWSGRLWTGVPPGGWRQGAPLPPAPAEALPASGRSVSGGGPAAAAPSVAILVNVPGAVPGGIWQEALDARPGAGLATFGTVARLLAVRLPQSAHPGQTVSATLAWLALGAAQTDLNAFVHLVGPGGDALAIGDAPPLGGSYPTTAWRPGEIVIDTYTLPLPPGTPAGQAELRVGWYDWRSGQRLPVTTAPGRDRDHGTAALAARTLVRPPGAP